MDRTLTLTPGSGPTLVSGKGSHYARSYEEAGWLAEDLAIAHPSRKIIVQPIEK